MSTTRRAMCTLKGDRHAERCKRKLKILTWTNRMDLIWLEGKHNKFNDITRALMTNFSSHIVTSEDNKCAVKMHLRTARQGLQDSCSLRILYFENIRRRTAPSRKSLDAGAKRHFTWCQLRGISPGTRRHQFECTDHRDLHTAVCIS